ncbi:hypothetical protein ACWOA2_07695 [Granulicatella elegans]
MSLDYRAFYQDVTDWIYQAQEVERIKGFGTDEYMDWIVQSVVQICEKYNNDKFVHKQMRMLWNHIDDAVIKTIGK